MHIRRAEERDTERVLDLLRQVNEIHQKGRPDIFRLGTKYTADELAAIFADEKRPVFVAVEDVDGVDTVLGYAFCIIEDHTDDNILTDIKTLYIDDLCVDETRRGGGIGSVLFHHVTEYAKEIGCYNVTLNVWCLNPGAMGFYDRLGMRPMKIYMETVISDGENEKS